MTEDTFTFNGVNSFDEYGIYVVPLDQIFPNKRDRKLEIPNAHGMLDFGSVAYDERRISFRCWLVNEMTRAEFRKVAYWLSKKGTLVLSNEPDKYYTAEVFIMPELKEDSLRRMQYFDIAFVCEPFAYSENRNVQLNPGLNNVNYEGTVETPVTLIIKNDGVEPVLNVQISFFNKEV